jgi:hypothetical protein
MEMLLLLNDSAATHNEDFYPAFPQIFKGLKTFKLMEVILVYM